MIETPDIQKVLDIALAAGEAVMAIYEKDFAVEYKDDKSPLTEADRKAHAIIADGLARLGDLPLLSEEGRDIPYEERKAWESYWCVDPIDGTKEFIKKNGEFTVNIALIHKGFPVLGVVYAPALGEIYWAKRGEGAWKAPVDRRGAIAESEKERLTPALKSEERKEAGELVIVASKSHLTPETQAFIDEAAHHAERVTRISKGSSLKLLMVAEGSADIYPRLAPTMEWDTAAADAIVREAGKKSYRYTEDFAVSGKSREELTYNKQNLLNPWFVVL